MARSTPLVFAILLTICTTVRADWSGGLELGTQLGSDESPALRLNLRNQGIPLSHHLYLDWIHESGSSRYRLGYNPTYTISQSIYSFGQFSVEQDEPGDIEREVNARIGIGNHLFRTNNSRLTLQAGLGGSRLKLADRSEQTDGFLFAGGLFSSKLIGLLKLEAMVELRLAEDQTVSTGQAGISFRVGPNTALKYAYSMKRYDFDSGTEDIVNEDSFLTFTYGF